MKPIATDIYAFERLINENKVYVDKTGEIYNLLNRDNGSIFFISRPRRFGKSLMISTLKCIFEAKKKLFKGLKIASLDYDWKKYPVIHLDMTKVADSTLKKIELNLKSYITSIAEDFNVKVSKQESVKFIFEKLIKELVKEHKEVVVLIDEYDAPIAGFLDSPKELIAVRKMLHDFYVNLKNNSGSIRFLMMTGVSKFSKLSVFSGLNNLTDLTLHPMCGKLLGYTDDEIDFYFKEHIQAFADDAGKSYEEVRETMRQKYDGYHFCKDFSYGVYNPVSVGQCLFNHEFRNYWSITGAATIIFERLKKARSIPNDLNSIIANTDDLDVCDAERLPLKALLFQGGYLTIKGVDVIGNYKLGIPNGEVHYALNNGFLKGCMKGGEEVSEHVLNAMALLAEGDVESVFNRVLPAVYSSLPCNWKIKNEAEAKRYFLLFFTLLGADIVGEKQVATGIPDAVLKTKDAIYILEFKYDKSPLIALNQIKKNRYADAFKSDKRKVVSVGVNYSTKNRTVVVKVRS